MANNLSGNDVLAALLFPEYRANLELRIGRDIYQDITTAELERLLGKVNTRNFIPIAKSAYISDFDLNVKNTFGLIAGYAQHNPKKFLFYCKTKENLDLANLSKEDLNKFFEDFAKLIEGVKTAKSPIEKDQGTASIILISLLFKGKEPKSWYIIGGSSVDINDFLQARQDGKKVVIEYLKKLKIEDFLVELENIFKIKLNDDEIGLLEQIALIAKNKPESFLNARKKKENFNLTEQSTEGLKEFLTDIYTNLYVNEDTKITKETLKMAGFQENEEIGSPQTTESLQNKGKSLGIFFLNLAEMALYAVCLVIVMTIFQPNPIIHPTTPTQTKPTEPQR